jgi:hypothetical protein
MLGHSMVSKHFMEPEGKKKNVKVKLSRNRPWRPIGL